MVATAEGLAEVARRLEARGVPVERRGGWRTRGRGRLRVRGHVEHCTSDAAPLSRARMIELLAEGHGSLANSLCTWAVPRERPAAVLIAARTSWHAGRGGWRGVSGNSSVSGTEIQRAAGQAITDEQLAIAEAITEEMVAVFGVPVERVCTHDDWTARKVDPVGVDGDAWRARIADTDPTPEPDDEEDDLMARFGPPLGVVKTEDDEWYLVRWWEARYRYIDDGEELAVLRDRCERDDHPEYGYLDRSAGEVVHDVHDGWASDWFLGYDREEPAAA